MNKRLLEAVNELIKDGNIVIYDNEAELQNELLKYLKENKIMHRYSDYDDYLFITTEEDGEED